MREELELIVIGDDHVRNSVYSAFSTSVQERKRKTSQPRFPSTFSENDNAISLGNSTHAEFAIAGKQIRYGIRKYTNNRDSLSFDSPVPFLHKGHLTVVVCINTEETDLEPNRFNYRIDQLMHLSDGKPFNIVPITVASHRNAQTNFDETCSQLNEAYPLLYRKGIVVDSNDLNSPEYTRHLSTTLDVTLATPIYNEIRNCINLLNKLEQSLYKTPIKCNETRDIFDLTPISNILNRSLNMIGSVDVNTMDSLRAYFNLNQQNLHTAFVQLKDDLNQRGDCNQTYISRIFLNILCSIAAIFASLTIVGIPFVYYALSQNSRYHNNCLKFFATNNIDADRASIVKVEDEMNRTVLSAH